VQESYQSTQAHQAVIDPDGFRPNVGIILANPAGQLLWARRVGQDAWQFPQGGIRRHETPEEAMFRELYEEVGLGPAHVEVIGCTRGWLRYRLPERFIRRHRRPLCVGQKQRWYVLRFVGDEADVCLSRAERPRVRQLAVGRVLGAPARGGVLQASCLPARVGRAGAAGLPEATLSGLPSRAHRLSPPRLLMASGPPTCPTLTAGPRPSDGRRSRATRAGC